MKFLAISLLVSSAFWNCGAEEDEKWEALVERLHVDNPGLDVAPTVEEAKFNGEMFEVKVMNNSREPLVYRGYSREDPQIFTKEFVDGDWIVGGWSWCGTGLGTHLIEPGESVHFTFDRHLEKRQLFVVFRMKENRSSLIKLRDPEIKQQASVESISASDKAALPARSGDESEDPFK